MGRRRTKMNKIREVIRMCTELRLSENKTHLALALSRPTVSKYLEAFNKSGLSYREIKYLSDTELEEILGLGSRNIKQRLQILYDKFPDFAVELKKTGVTKQLLWEEYREEYPSGYSYSQFCYHFQNWQNSSKLTMHFQHKAGDKMFVDFAGKKMYYVDPDSGKTQEVQIFIGVLGASKLIYSEPVMTQQIDDWLNANHNTFRYFGGVPRAVVPDCLKSGVTKGNKYEPDINPVYADFAEHYGTAIIPARPYKPKDKALVENAVRMIYRNIFAPLRNRTFYSFEELKRAFRERLDILNSKKMQHLKISRFELWNKVEKNVLKPIPSERYERRFFKRLKVRSNYHIFLNEDEHYYSVPYKYRNKRVKVAYTAQNVEIFHNNLRIAFHKRSKQPGGYTTVLSHMPKNHRYIHDWTPQNFIDKAEKIGNDTAAFVRKVLKSKSHPEQGYKICAGLISLARKYGNIRLEKACRIGLEFNKFSYKSINNILKNGMENKNKEVIKTDGLLPVHENIRGKEYYLQTEVQ